MPVRIGATSASASNKEQCCQECGLEKSAQDELGQEIVEDAWVWKVYNDEATKADDALFEACNRGMDVLLADGFILGCVDDVRRTIVSTDAPLFRRHHQRPISAINRTSGQ